jgi:hypothetical protein
MPSAQSATVSLRRNVSYGGAAAAATWERSFDCCSECAFSWRSVARCSDSEGEVRALNDHIVSLYGGQSQFYLDELPHEAVDDRARLASTVQRARLRLWAVQFEEEFLLNIAACHGIVDLAEACLARIETHVASLVTDTREVRVPGGSQDYALVPWGLVQAWGGDISVAVPELARQDMLTRSGRFASQLDCV